MVKVKIDKEKCIGCGACEAVCPEVFELKGNKAFAKKTVSDEKCVKEAVESCPVCAISLG